MNMLIHPLDAPFRARVEGWVPGDAISRDEVEKLRCGLDEHLFLLFRGHPEPGDNDLAGLGRCFGDLAEALDPDAGLDRHPNILHVSNEAGDDGTMRGVGGTGVIPWHLDYSVTIRPAKETLLEARIIPEDRGATCFCNLYRAWERLPASLKDRLTGLRARHDGSGGEIEVTDSFGATGRGEYDKARFAAETEAERLQTEEERWDASYLPHHGVVLADRPAWHPLAFSNSETGKTALYVSSFISEIEGMDRAAAVELRDELIAHATGTGNVYRHEWQGGDLIVFDAVGGLHRRDSFDRGQLRAMRQLSTLLPLPQASL